MVEFGLLRPRGFGWTVGEPVFDWPTLLANKDREIARLNGVYERVLQVAGVQITPGRATVRSPHEVEINGKTVTARHILVATGSWPVLPPIPGRELAITSNEAFHFEFRGADKAPPHPHQLSPRTCGFS